MTASRRSQRDRAVVAQVVERRVANRHGQCRRLGDRELVEGLAEVLLGGSGNPVGVLAEEHRVQVVLEDLLLGKAPLEFDGDRRLGNFALEG